jgi:Ca-activated chloride channel family protein
MLESTQGTIFAKQTSYTTKGKNYNKVLFSMGITFIEPQILWFLLLIPLTWALSLNIPRRLPTKRFWASLILRSAIIASLVLALAGTQLQRTVSGLTTVFVLDSSDSITPQARQDAQNFIDQAISNMPEGDQAAIVVFGQNALVERAPSTDKRATNYKSIPTISRTNIQEALQLGLALFPAASQKRIVLLSDGGENSGSAISAEQLIRARGAVIDYIDLSSATPDQDTRIVALDSPYNVRQGQSFELTTTIESPTAQSAQLRIFGDEQLLFDQNIQLNPGTNRFTLQVDAPSIGFQRYRAQIEPTNDERSQNNQAEAIVRVGGSAKILLVASEPNEAEVLRSALDASNVAAQIVTPNMVPNDLTSLSEYDAVALVNVPRSALPNNFVEIIPSYVRDLGKGFLMLGGNRSFGLGSYNKTPIETALPVYMDVRNREEFPEVEILFVIDKSGSMNACHCAGPNASASMQITGGTPKIDLAKEAVIQASTVLSERDSIGVIAFDEVAQWALPVTRGADPADVERAVVPVLPDGNTNVRAGLSAAEEAMRQSTAKIKHVVLLTDGWTQGNEQISDIVSRLRDMSVTLSVVAAGTGSADYLAETAELGNGRYYASATMEEVPQIFVQETVTALGFYMIEEPFTPAYSAPSAIMEGLESGLPQLYGYNGSTAKETATTVLLSNEKMPVLAQWQYGLGRSVAWLSDAKGQWAKDWINWQEFPRFAAQMVMWTVPSTSQNNLNATISTEGNQTIINVEAFDPNNKPQDNLELRATMLDEQGQAQEVLLSQVGPGQYRASIESPDQGSYVLQFVGINDGNIVAQNTAGLVVPYSAEYRQNQSNPELLAQLADETGGQRIERPEQAFAPLDQPVRNPQPISMALLILALILLPFDIAVRRLGLQASDLNNFRKPPSAPRPPSAPQAPEHIQRLRQARDRANHRQKR